MFISTFPGNLLSCKWIRDHFVQPTLSSFTEQKQKTILTLAVIQYFLEKIVQLRKSDKFIWISLSDECPVLAKKSARNSYPFRNVVFKLIRTFCHGEREWQFHKFFQDSTKFVKISKSKHHVKTVVPNRGRIPPQGGILWIQGRNFHFIGKFTLNLCHNTRFCWQLLVPLFDDIKFLSHFY